MPYSICKELFLSVLGITPQVLTECLYYYYSPHYQQNRHFNQILVFTSAAGKTKIIDTIIRDNKIRKIEKVLNLQKGTIPFSKEDIIVFTDKKGNEIDDLRTTEDSLYSMNILFEKIMEFTNDPKIRITATLAGGRKTMSSMMAMAFQLYGREQDELIHIMTSDKIMFPETPEDKEKYKNWFFPENPDDLDEKLEVTRVPILKVGRYLGKSLNLPAMDLMEKIQKELVDNSPISELKIYGNIFKSGDEILKLSPSEATVLRYLIRKRIEASCEFDCSGCQQCFTTRFDLQNDFYDGFMEERILAAGEYSEQIVRMREEIKKPSKNQDEENYQKISQYKSKLSKKVVQADISIKFKNAITICEKTLNPKYTDENWFGVAINPNVVTIEK